MARTTFPGLVLLDERFTFENFSAATSTYTESGPLPGTPEDRAASPMVLETTGTQTADHAALVVRGGMPGIDEAGLVFAPDADAGDEWKGWNPPTSISDFEALVYVSSADAHRCFDIARTADSAVILDFAGTRYVNAWRYEGSSFGWSGPVTIYDNGAAYTTILAHPAITADEDGNPIAFWLVENSAGTYAQVRVARSEDAGATWTTVQRSALREPIDITGTVPRRMRACQKNGEVLLIIGASVASLTYDDVLIQYASTDGGLNFGLVDTWTGADEEHHGAFPSIAVADGQFVVAYLRRTSSGDATTARPYIRRIGSAATPLSGSEAVLAQSASNAMRWATLTANVFDVGSGDCALSADEHGALWLIGRDVADDHQCVTYASFDGGDTWIDDDLGGSSAAAVGPVWWDGQDSSTHPKAMAAAWWGGGLFVVHACAANPGTGDDSLMVLTLGGYTRAEMPLETDTARHYTRASWERTWLPYDLPENVGGIWTKTLTGTPAITLDTTTGALKIVAAGGEGVYWRATPAAGTLAQGVAAMADFEVTSGPSQYIELRAGVAGPASYRVRISVTTTSVVVYDEEGAAMVDTEPITSDRVQILAWLGNSAAVPGNDGQIRVWIREPDALTASARPWREISQHGNMVKGASTTHQIEFGAGVGASETYTKIVQFTSGTYAGVGWYTGINPTTLQGRAVSANWMDLDADGLKVRCTNGPGRKGDAWLLPVRHTYGIENVHWEKHPSPLEYWRSSSTDGTAVTLDWLFGVSQRGRGTSRSLGVYLDANIRYAEVWLMDPGGSWVKHADINASSGQTGLSWVRGGVVVWPDAGTAAGSYAWGDHELAGDYIELDDGVTSVVRKIRSNNGGAWAVATGVQPVYIEMEGADATEPASGTAANLISRRTLTIINDVSAYRGFRLVIPAQQTAENYFIIRGLHVGPVALFAHPYTSSRDEGIESHTVLTEAPSGARRSRVMHEPTRYAEFGWEEGILPTLAYATTPAPRAQALYTSGVGVSSPDLASYHLTGIFERVHGSDRPVVYFSSLDVQQASSTDVTIVQPRRLVRGRILSEELKRTTVRGEEDSATLPEVHRLSRARVSEEP